MKEKVMSTEYAIILLLNGLLFALCTFVVGVMLRMALLRPKKREASGDDEATDDFAEFYLDLHRYAVDADFTRQEAEALYKVWQRQEKERSRNISSV